MNPDNPVLRSNHPYLKTMKKNIFAVLIALFTLSFVADVPTDRIGVKGPLKFDKTDFNLAWTDKPRDTYFIQEYLPAGEKPESFNRMLTIHIFDSDMSANNAVSQKVKELTERKKTDIVCNYQVTESPDGNEFIVDFLLSESKNEEMTIVEFNVYRYKQVNISEKKKGVLVYAFSKRSYGDNITDFLKSLKEVRMNYLNEMVAVELPKIIIDVK